MEPSLELEIGSLFDGRYLVQALLGKGGSGAIYRALQVQLNRVVALKVLLPELLSDDESLQRFLQEGQTLCRLFHQNILVAFSCAVSEGGMPYLVMDYLEGQVLGQMVNEAGGLDAGRAVYIFRQICDGLAYAHAAGAIHRDLKPENIMLVLSNDVADSVKILDFGFARLLPHSGLKKETLTGTGSVLGTPLFMSPEQWHSSRVDERSDLYSLGSVMYYVLTGQTPLDMDEVLGNAFEGKAHKALALNKKKPGLRISSELEEVVFRCLKTDPNDRFHSANDLKAAIDQTPEFYKAEGLPVPRERTSLPKAGTVLVGLAVAGLFILFFYLAGGYQSSQKGISSQLLAKNAESASSPEHFLVRKSWNDFKRSSQFRNADQGERTRLCRSWMKNCLKRNAMDVGRLEICEAWEACHAAGWPQGVEMLKEYARCLKLVCYKSNSSAGPFLSEHLAEASQEAEQLKDPALARSLYESSFQALVDSSELFNNYDTLLRVGTKLNELRQFKLVALLYPRYTAAESGTEKQALFYLQIAKALIQVQKKKEALVCLQKVERSAPASLTPAVRAALRAVRLRAGLPLESREDVGAEPESASKK